LFKCKNCGHDVPHSERVCPVCNQDVGYPNVRYAERSDEVASLEARVEAAFASARVRGTEPETAAFLLRAGASKAIMNRRLEVLHSWLNDSNPLFISFHQQVRSGARLADDTPWDQQRTSAENTINPNYFSNLSFGALSLDAVGMEYYGPYCVALRDDLIAHRTTVFEENPFEFNRKHSVISGQMPPPGYRAPWMQRGKLAVSKLGVKILSGMTDADFSDVLLEPRRTKSDCDFIEVHVYGPIHHAAIEHVSGPVPKARADNVIWKDVKRKLRAIGASWDEH
jgi:hypothetical protein